MFLPAGSKMKGSCRFGAYSAIIRHLVEKVSLTPYFKKEVLKPVLIRGPLARGNEYNGE
jgi:hypothetical protein